MSLAAISEYIYGKIKDTENSQLTLKNIYLIIFLRNGYDEYNNDNSWNCRMEESLFEYITNTCERDGIKIDYDILEKILDLADEINVKESESYLSGTEEHELTAYINKDSCCKEYKFKTWTKWDECIDKAIDDFYNKFNISPNYLEANEHTFSQIDFVTNLQKEIKHENIYFINEKSGEKNHAHEEEDIEIGSYLTDETEVFFCYNNELIDKQFVLGFDIDDDEDDDNDDDNINVIDPVDKGVLVES